MLSNIINSYKQSSSNNFVEHLIRRLSVLFYTPRVNKVSLQDFELEANTIRKEDDHFDPEVTYSLRQKSIIWLLLKICLFLTVGLVGAILLTGGITIFFDSINREASDSLLNAFVPVVAFLGLARRANHAQDDFLKYFQIYFNPEIRVFPLNSVFNIHTLLFILRISSVSQPVEIVEKHRLALIRKTYQCIAFFILWIPINFLIFYISPL